MKHIEEIDVHNSEASYQKTLDNFRTDLGVNPKNRDYILNFLSDCQIGKTVIKKAKKKIRSKRLLKYLSVMKKADYFLKKDFKAVTQSEMEDFIRKLENDKLTVVNKDGSIKRLVYGEWSKHDIKIALKKFYKWLLGNNIEYPSIVAWIDTHVKETDPPALNKEEIAILAEKATGRRSKALVWCLFETGARISELLNVRLCHVTDKKNYLVVRIEFSKTFKRSVPIFEGQSILREWLAAHPDKKNPEAQLFPIKYGALRMWLKRLGKRALEKDVHPHLIRHSYATWLAGKKVGRYQMCKLMGWSMSSNMPDRYIDRLGVIEEETIQSIRGDELTKEQAINTELKNELNELQMKYNSIIEQLEKRKSADDFMQKIVSDAEVQQLICQKIKEMDLKSELSQL
ncbi:hypothetical protein DESC_540015 [Desulfosarcina cetonica]|uniref:tyrosine-type recombinase/integrase n=1 Tax=Desulfosarcina cetonica TaxID=90730 RepID=UPI0006D2637D|nr:site-specific integrase [Desulfosarcina cetonica]VTR66925.1 hypothetical protein DESC_540015 [Desulfosarcina cetonica]